MSFLPFVSAILMSAAALAGPLPDEVGDPMPVAREEAAMRGPLYEAVKAADLHFFHAAFDLCNPDALAGMVTDDLEFFHDRHGVIAKSGAQFIADFRDHCEKQKAGTDFLSRRELVPGSLRVYPLGPDMAFEMGAHRFFKLVAGKPDQLTETALFAQVWQHVDGVWKLARVVSYNHKDAPEPAS